MLVVINELALRGRFCLVINKRIKTWIFVFKVSYAKTQILSQMFISLALVDQRTRGGQDSGRFVPVAERILSLLFQKRTEFFSSHAGQHPVWHETGRIRK